MGVLSTSHLDNGFYFNILLPTLTIPFTFDRCSILLKLQNQFRSKKENLGTIISTKSPRTHVVKGLSRAGPSSPFKLSTSETKR